MGKQGKPYIDNTETKETKLRACNEVKKDQKVLLTNIEMTSMTRQYIIC